MVSWYGYEVGGALGMGLWLVVLLFSLVLLPLFGFGKSSSKFREAIDSAAPFPRPLVEPPPERNIKYKIPGPCLVVGWDRSGGLSQALVKALIQQGCAVTIAPNTVGIAELEKYDALCVVEGSLDDKEVRSRACVGVRTVFCTLPIDFPPSTLEDIVRDCGEAGAAVLLLASVSSMIRDASDQTCVIAESVLEAERIVRSANGSLRTGIRTAIIRSQSLFGGNSNDSFVSALLLGARSGNLYVEGADAHSAAMTFTGNFVHAQLKVAETLSSEAGHKWTGNTFVLPQDNISFDAFIQRLCEAFGYNSPKRNSQRPPQLMVAVPHITEAKCLSELGFETPYSLEDAFRNTVTEMAEHLNRQAVRAHGLKHVGRYTRTQVAVHNNSKDLWVVIDGRIYDLTAFIELHPGGEDAIFQNAGGDASEGFHGPQHPVTVWDVLPKYLIGDLME